MKKMSVLLSTAIATGLIAAQQAKADNHENTESEKISDEKNKCKGQDEGKNSCKGMEDKNSCKGQKAKDKSSCAGQMKKKKKEKHSCKNGCEQTDTKGK